MDTRKKAFIVNTLRRATYRWPSRWSAEKRSKVDRGLYFCEACGVIERKKNTAMDHLLPVVDPQTGFNGFNNDYMDRMFPDTQYGWQRLCHPCHQIKTDSENKVRKDTKNKKKLDNN